MVLLGQFLVSKRYRPIEIEGAKSPVSMAYSISAFQDPTHPPTKSCTAMRYEVASESSVPSRACLLSYSVVLIVSRFDSQSFFVLRVYL